MTTTANEAAGLLEAACRYCGDPVFAHDEIAETRDGWAHKGCQEEYDEERMAWELDASEGMGD